MYTKKCLALRTSIFVGLVGILLFIDISSANAAQKDTITIFVSILPQVDFVQKIGGSRIQVFPMVLPGQSPATFAPTPKQIAALAGADLYFRIGVPFENSLVPKMRRNLPDLAINDLRSGLHLIVEDTKGHDHGDEHGHGGEHDPHIWLDPMLVNHMAITIRDALIALDPSGADTYQANCASFQSELKQLHQLLQATLQPFAGQKIYVFHPSYAYFCRAYGLVQKSIVPGGRAPGARQLSRLIEQAGREGVRYIFVQPQFSRKTAEAIAGAIGATLIVLDPLADNYIENMTSIAHSISNALNPSNNQ